MRTIWDCLQCGLRRFAEDLVGPLTEDEAATLTRRAAFVLISLLLVASIGVFVFTSR